MSDSLATTSDLALEVRAARKTFGSVVALEGVDLSVRSGEVLALLGDNGAGKSTLIKALSGVYSLDGGEIRINGRIANFRSPADARAHGIETVFQDLAVFDNLNVIDNLFIGRELSYLSGLGPLAILRKRKMVSEWKRYTEALQVGIKDAFQPVGLMSGGQRQAIALARAFAFAGRIIILDEPTAALGVRETGNVLRLIKQLAAQGIAVILISHNIQNVLEVADRVTVLRQGRLVGHCPATPDMQQRIVSMIVGAQHELVA